MARLRARGLAALAVPRGALPPRRPVGRTNCDHTDPSTTHTETRVPVAACWEGTTHQGPLRCVRGRSSWGLLMEGQGHMAEEDNGDAATRSPEDLSVLAPTLPPTGLQVKKLEVQSSPGGVSVRSRYPACAHPDPQPR